MIKMSKKNSVRTYSIKEVSKKMNIPVGTIRQWEKDLNGLLVIPRNENNARYFTENEIELLDKIKGMREKNVSKDLIRSLLTEEALEQSKEADISTATEIALKIANISNASLVEKKRENEAQQAKIQANIEEFFAALQQYKLDFLQDIKDTVAYNQAEVMDEMKKEISSSSIHTIRQVSKSIQRANEKRKDELKQLSHAVTQASEHTSESFEDIAKTIKNDSKIGLERLSKKLMDNSKANIKENKSFYLRVTKAVTEASESIDKAADSLDEKQQILLQKMNELKESTEEIREREEVFQEMLKTFREAAAAKPEKKQWWKLWLK